MPVPKIASGGGRDAMVDRLLGAQPGPEAEEAPTVEPAVASPPRPRAVSPAAPAGAEIDTPAATATPEAAPAVPPSPAAPHADATELPAQPIWEVDQRLKTVHPDPAKAEPKVQIANRIPVSLRDRLDRHRQRTGEPINSVLVRMLELALEVAEAEAGVDKDGRPLPKDGKSR